MLNKIIKYIRKPFGLLDLNTVDVLKTSSATMIVRVGGIAFGVFISIFLGRTLGANGLGVISLANQIIGILLMLSLLGLPTVILKEVSIAYSRKDWEHANSVMGTSMRINGIAVLFIMVIVYLLLPFTIKRVFKEPLLRVPLMIFLVAMVFQVFARIFASGVNGYRKIWQSSLVNDALSMFIVAICLLVQYLANYKITIISVAWYYFIARVLVSIIMGLYWRKIHFPSAHINFIPKAIIKVALPLLFAQATAIIANSTDTIMIGGLLTAKDVGLYTVALKITIVSNFILQVLNSVIAPKVASMYAENRINELESMVQKLTKYLSLIAVLIFVTIFVFGRSVLMLWGNEFVNSYSVLIILSINQVIAVTFGSVGLLLTMCNQEKKWGLLTLISAILNIILNYFFIKLWGYTGAAVATTLTGGFMKITAVYLVKREIGIQLLPLPKHKN